MLTKQLLSEYQELRGIWRKQPWLYARQRLGLNPTKQQQQLFEAIAPPGAKVSARAGHGVGKSGATSGIVLWQLECFDYPKIPCTAPTSAQLFDILWAEIIKWTRRSDEISARNGLPPELWLTNMFRVTQDRIADVSNPNEWFAVARTSRKENPDALQGFHVTDLTIDENDQAIQRSEAGGNILFIVEEASGVPDEVFQVAEGALSSEGARLLLVGNPTKNTGFFARSHKQDRASYTTLHFRCDESPLVASGYRADLVRKYGEGSNVVRVRADGEFPKQDDDVLISLEDAEAMMMRQTAEPGKDRRLGVDVARFGSDRTVYTLRDGSRIEHIEVRAREDTMQTAGRAKLLFEQLNATAVYVDTIGVGAGVYDRLKEEKVPVVSVNVAEAAPVRRRGGETEAQGRLLRDHLWMETARWIREAEPALIGVRRDVAEDLVGELASVLYRLDGQGRIQVESKDDMRKRLQRSPDLADSLAVTLYEPPGSGLLDYYARLVAAKTPAPADPQPELADQGIPA